MVAPDGSRLFVVPYLIRQKCFKAILISHRFYVCIHISTQIELLLLLLLPVVFKSYANNNHVIVD